MVAHIPYPADDIDDSPAPAAHDQAIPFTKGLLIEFREACGQRDGLIDELRRDNKMLRERCSRLERASDETNITLTELECRLDHLVEQLDSPAVPDMARSVPDPLPIAGAIAQPITLIGADLHLAELNRGMNLIIHGLAIYCRHGVDLGELIGRAFPLFAAAAEQAAANRPLER